VDAWLDKLTNFGVLGVVCSILFAGIWQLFKLKEAAHKEDQEKRDELQKRHEAEQATERDAHRASEEALRAYYGSQLDAARKALEEAREKYLASLEAQAARWAGQQQETRAAAVQQIQQERQACERCHQALSELARELREGRK
jgi:hypothetical protein